MRVLVVNSGSSSLKFQVIEATPTHGNDKASPFQLLLKSSLNEIGNHASLQIKSEGAVQTKEYRKVPHHDDAIQWMIETLRKKQATGEATTWLDGIDAVGHRIVHGGERFSHSTLLNSEVLSDLEGLNELAPLHNPPGLAAIRSLQGVLGETIPMVAVYDTAFHSTLPKKAQMYALHYEIAERYGIRRYGFHGIAHASLAAGYAACAGKDLKESRVITFQLGNGCSVSAIANGQSVDTSMGFTPLEGLVMGTRSGDLDPSIVSYLMDHYNLTKRDVAHFLNDQSGLLGLSGRSSDMRELLGVAQEGDTHANLAIDVFCYRAKKYLGGYLAVLGGADAVVFGGGIGENASEIRAKICEGMEWCGLTLNPHQNAKAIGVEPGSGVFISEESSPLAACVVGTDEETWIARETFECIQSTKKSGRKTNHVA